MLRAPEHQVAGHQAVNGNLGPLIDGSGRFYKPLQSDDRGSHELAFYTSFSSNPRVPLHIRRFFPGFFGTKLLEASDGSGRHPHIVLQDLTSNFSRPSLVDIKIGSRTWYPSCAQDYFEKSVKKDRESTSVRLGFRISGLQVRREGSELWTPDKDTVKGFGPEDVRRVLRRFVSANPNTDSDPDNEFAVDVYGGSGGILAQLQELKAWFEDQTLYHFYSSSVLIMYEKGVRAEVKLVDFAHVEDGEGVIDHNFVGGLCSLIKFISEILRGSDSAEF